MTQAMPTTAQLRELGLASPPLFEPTKSSGGHITGCGLVLPLSPVFLMAGHYWHFSGGSFGVSPERFNARRASRFPCKSLVMKG
jgi:hypothetical protein